MNVNEMVKINTFLIQRQWVGEDKIGYWENRWATGQNQWHKKDINPFLSKYFAELEVMKHICSFLIQPFRFIYPIPNRFQQQH